MEVLYIMYVEIERNVRGYQVVTLCNGLGKYIVQIVLV